MNKKLAAIAISLTLSLAGCSGAPVNDVSVYVAPETFGGDSVVPASAPSAALPEREKLGRTMPAYQYDAADDVSDTLYTDSMRYAIDGHYFVGEELTFALPEGWVESNFELRITKQTLAGYDIRQFMFYFIDPVSAQAALIMKVDSIPAEYQENYGVEYGEKLGASYDGSYMYYRAAVAGSAPDGFADEERYNQTLAALTAPDYKIQINV